MTLDGRDLRKRYGAIAALDGFDLRIGAGEVVGLVGPNGAGKTTFVEVVAGLVRPDAGTVLVDGLDWSARPAGARNRIGVAPQELGLYLSLTVRENLRLFAGLAGLRGRARRTAIDETGTALGLTGVLDRQVGLLSGGQRRRTQAATALVHRPPLLLLDEPTAGADPETRRALLELVRRRADDGAAVCYTTHYLPELVELQATLAVAKAGRVVARGTQAELLADLTAEVRLTLDSGEERRLRTSDPAAALATAVAQQMPIRAIEVHQPSLDDLYRSLAAKPSHQP